MQRDGLIRFSIYFVFAFLFATATAAAQTPTNKTFVRGLFFQGVVDPQESPALVNQIASDSADAIAKFIAAALATAPVASSSAGFAYVRDKTTGELSLKSESFGPTFADRPLTNGKRVWTFGANYQHSRTNFDGAFGTADNRDEGLPIFDNTATYTTTDGFVQYITKRAFLESRSDTVHFRTTYGLTDRLDVGVVVPIISLKLEGRAEEAYDLTRQFNAGEVPLSDRPTAVGILNSTQGSKRSTSGIGDITFRAKYFVAGRESSGIAVAADVRVPTGSEDDLLGAGKASVKLQALVLKSDIGPVSFHANGGYTAGGLSDEVNYVVGVDQALLSRKQLTASVSFLGRVLRDAALPTRTPTVRRSVNNGTTGPREIVVDRFIWSTQSMNLAQVAAGLKWNVSGKWLLDATVLIPLNQRGFQPHVAPTIGIERTWND